MGFVRSRGAGQDVARLRRGVDQHRGQRPPPPASIAGVRVAGAASPPRGHREREGLPRAPGVRDDTRSPATVSENPGGSPAGLSPALSSSLLITAGGTVNAGCN